jgi:hypothetical protein
MEVVTDWGLVALSFSFLNLIKTVWADFARRCLPFVLIVACWTFDLSFSARAVIPFITAIT